MEDRSNMQKVIRTALIVAISIIVNVLGKKIAVKYELPLWLDSVGTVFAAYVLGPFCGGITGLTGNVIYSIICGSSLVYGITNLFIGISVGFAAKKKLFSSFFRAMSVAGVVTILSVVISATINIIMYGGSSGNIWGDAVRDFLYEKGIPELPGGIIGELYIDFLDKLVTVLLLYVVIVIYRYNKDKKEHIEDEIDDVRKKIDETVRENDRHQHHKGIHKKTLSILLTFAFAGSMTMAGIQGTEVCSADEGSNAVEEGTSYIQTVYGRDNGLPCGNANDIEQTNDGILWIGTYAGLYRYDGKKFRAMKEYTAVKNVNCLYTDQEGRLWIGTNDNGLVIAINDRVVNVLDISSGLASDSVKSIVQDSNGDYYVGTAGGLMILKLHAGIVIEGTIEGINNVEAMSADENGHVAAVTSDGILYIIEDRKISDEFRMNEEEGGYTCCSYDNEGTLYAGTSEGKISVYNAPDSKGRIVRSRDIECTGLTKLNHIFMKGGSAGICADNGIGFLYNMKRFVKKETVDFNYSVEKMLVDYQGNMWFASSRLGVLRLCKSSFTDIYGETGLGNSVVNTTVIWNDMLYVGSDDGLKIIDTASYTEVKNELTGILEGMRIRCMEKTSDGHLWLCTYGRGIIELDEKGTPVFYDSPEGGIGSRVRVCTELKDGTIAIGGDNGLSYIKDGDIIKTVPYEGEFGAARILCFLEGNDGKLYCGTDGNGIVVVKDGKVEKHITREDGLSSGVILRMIKDIEGNNTFIVTSNGICYMEDAVIRTLDNYPYSNNYDIYIKEDGNMFVTGSAGIYIVNREDLLTKKTFDYTIMDSHEGLGASLTANAWNYVDDDMNMYLSTDRGVYMINLNNYMPDRLTYRIKISGILIDGERYPYDTGNTINISRDVSKVELIPQIINYSMEEPEVSYYLEGLENSSKNVSLKELSNVVYTNLPSGKYVFHLSIVDKKTGKVTEEAVYNIIKEKSLYDNTWFTVYFVVVGGLFIGWLTWFITRTQIQRTLELQQSRLQLAMQQVQMGNETILAIAKTVDAKDVRTSKHSQRVSDYSVLIAKELGFTEKEQENLKRAALLHDIGKIGIPDSVLNKPSRLTDEEYAVMKSHVTVGAQILKDVTMIENVVDGARYHHERYDGKGYPDGLKGDEIPLYGRIIAVADAFDAMTANRIYRKKQDFDYVFDELRKGRGTQFDPKVLDIFLGLLENKTIDLDWLYSKDYKQGDGMDE